MSRQDRPKGYSRQGSARRAESSFRAGTAAGPLIAPGRRKAFLLTMSFVLVTLSILSFAKFISHDADSEQLIFQSFAATARLDDLDSSIQNCIREIFSSYTDIEVAIDNNTATINDNLQGDYGGLASALYRLRNLSESESITIDIDAESSAEAVELVILPQNISYIHNLSRKDISINLSGNASSNITGFKTRLVLPQNITCSWSSVPGTFSYELEVSSPKDSGCDFIRGIDLDSGAEIDVVSDENPDNRITITLSSSSISMVLDNSSTFTAETETAITFKDSQESVFFGKDTLKISLDEFSIAKKGGVRIA